MSNLVPSDRHGVFLDAVLAGDKLEIAGKKAGFSTPQRDAYPILNTPTVRSYFRKIIRGKAETEGLAIAYNFFVDTIRDDKLDRKLRLEAAKFVYGHHMPAVKAADSPDDNEKQPSEMSNEELRQFIEQSEAELAARATPVQQALDDYL